jgi:hypothetical protein
LVIGSVLLQPQRLERASQRATDEAVLDDLIILATVLVADGIEGGSLAEMLGDSVFGTVGRLAERTGAGVNSASTRLKGLFQPLIVPAQALIIEQPPDDAGIITAVEDTLIAIVNTLKNLSPTQIRATMNEVFDILDTDLGITPTFVQEMVLGLFDDMVLALQPPPPDETPSQRANRRAASGAISRIRRAMPGLFIFPSLNADDAAQALLTLLQRPDASEALARATCSGEAAAAYFRAGRDLTGLLPYSGFPTFGEGGMGAAATAPNREEICFYASKLLEFDNRDGDLGKLPLPAETTLSDGRVDDSLRDAFLHCSVVLARSAFMYTEKENKKWTVVDRKKYLVRWLTGTKFWVYRLFELSENDFLSAIAGDLSGLRKVFRENGILLLQSDDVQVNHQVGSNLWIINAGGRTYNAYTFEGTITIHPDSAAGILFETSGDFMADLSAKKLSPALRQVFETNGIPLTSRASVSVRETGSQWLLDDGDFEYTIKKDEGKFEVSTGGILGWIHANILSLAGFKGDLVWINRERTQVLLNQRIMHVGTNVSWQDAPIFKRLPNSNNRHYSLINAADTIEGWAYHTSWILDAVNIAINGAKIGVSIADDDFAYSLASDSYDTGRLISELIIKLAQQRPMTAVVGIGFWYDVILDLVGYLFKGAQALAKSLAEESPPSDPTASDFSKFVDSVLSAVVGREILDSHWSGTLYEFTLSLLTLINHLEPQQTTQERPENYKESGGFVDVFWKVSLLVYAAAVPDDEYALPFQTASLTAGYWLGGALGVGLVSGFMGILIGQAGVAGVNVFADGGHLAKTLFLKTCGKSLLYFWPYLKLVKDKNE